MHYAEITTPQKLLRERKTDTQEEDEEKEREKEKYKKSGTIFSKRKEGLVFLYKKQK